VKNLCSTLSPAIFYRTAKTTRLQIHRLLQTSAPPGRNYSVVDAFCGSNCSNQEVRMRRIVIAAAIAASAMIGIAGAASAQGVEVDVGRGGVRVGPGYHHGWDRDRWHRAYGYERGCRVIVTHRVNRFGERVTVRRRVCG
jgi:hypothetical protein